MKINFVDLKRQYDSIRPEVDGAIANVIENTDFIMGKDVTEFEKEFARFCRSKHCIGVSSGTSALGMALKAAGIKQGDEVITVPNTFIATALAISEVGAKPVFVEIDKDTYNMDPSMIRKAITPKTKAIMPVHLFGQCADMTPIKETASEFGLKIIEDACQAHGAEYKGKKAPVTSTACFSFYPGKNLGAYGDAGAVVTDDDQIAEDLIMQRNYGQKVKYHHLCKGTNSRMDTIQAAILRVKLKHLDKWNSMRRKNAKIYDEMLEGYVATPKEGKNNKHVYHLYVIETKNRDVMLEELKKDQIYCGIHYPIPLHLQKAYKDLGIKEGLFPITEKAAAQMLSLPMFPEMSQDEIVSVCDNIKRLV